ncbi:hypothetical protein [Nonlabens sp.]|uniref:hypothetical protein n=1 Tax=Nonlabens sp. TaxID=1888209 RepID=UPI003F69DB17
MKEKILFKETQRFNQWWLWVILSVSLGVPVVFMSIDAVQSFEATKLIPIILFVALFLFIFVMRLDTRITEEKIAIHFYPFVKREFPWEHLKKAQVIDYGFIGGWGIRLWTDYGTAYNVRGSMGLHLKTTDKEYIIGTQKEKELRESIAHLLK